MARNSFCMLMLGVIGIALLGFFSAFGSSWGLLKEEYTHGDVAREWLLLGGLTSTSCQIKAKLPLTSMDSPLELVVSVQQDFDLSNANAENHHTSTTNNTTATNNVIIIPLANQDITLGVRHDIYTMQVTGLVPDTQYYYSIISRSSSIPRLSGTFKTPAPEGTRFNFTIAASSCAWTGSKANVFTEIQQEEPLLFLHMGDFHYEDISQDNLQKRVDAVGQVLASNPQAELYRSTALAYMWDDHDWLGNNANGNDGDRAARTTALQSYQVAFPHYPLAATTNNNNNNNNNSGVVSPYHAFTIGTVRFIISDLRSTSTDTHVMSGEQKAWLKRELGSASEYDFVLWVTTRPWIGKSDLDGDAWNRYVDDRRELSDFIATELGGTSSNASAQNLLVLSGDSHSVAFDDGTNTYYGNATSSDEPVRSFPLLHSGALDRIGNTKGKHFTHGCYGFDLDRTHQYSTLSFEFGNNAHNDDDDEKCIQIRSYRTYTFAEGERDEIFSHRLCNRFFQSAAKTEQEKVGKCEIDQLWSVNRGIVITALVLTCVLSVASCFFLQMSDATNIGDCCLKSTATFVLIVLSFLGTLFVGVGVYWGRGVKQYTLTPTLIVLLLQTVLLLLYLCFWIAFCTHSNHRHRRKNDNGENTE